MTKITRNIIESYLSCRYKGHLRLSGASGTKSDYETMTTTATSSSREQAVARLVARFGEGDACQGMTITVATLKQEAPLLADAALEDEGLSLRFDALKRVVVDIHRFRDAVRECQNAVTRLQSDLARAVLEAVEHTER